MFEKISFRHQRKKSGQYLDIGLLLESMIFYGRVCVIADHNSLKQLIFTFGFEILNDLLDAKVLQIVYTETQSAIVSAPNEKGVPVYGAVLISSPQQTFHTEIVKFCQEFTKKEGKGRRNALRLEKKITISNHDIAVTGSANQILLNIDFLDEAIPLLIKDAIPELGAFPRGAIFKTEEVERGFIVHTNLDFEKLNQLYHKHVSPKYSSISESHLLSQIFSVECDLHFASRQMSEIATSPVSSLLIKKDFLTWRIAVIKALSTKTNFKILFLRIIAPFEKATIEEKFRCPR